MPTIPGLPPELAALIDKVPSKRALVVINHIVEHGMITTEELEKQYGYNHPPRAARDVRECGIPLDTISVQSSDGKPIAAYRFGDLSTVNHNKAGGRTTFSKPFKDSLYRLSHGKCAICQTAYEDRYLQIDHRVPYEVGGEPGGVRAPDDYMLLCASCNRAKSWSCEHCINWLTTKDANVCLKCYWGVPESYVHIALRNVRRIDIVWDSGEVEVFEKLKAHSGSETMPEYVKRILAKVTQNW